MSNIEDRIARIEEKLGGDGKSPLDRFSDWVDKLERAEDEVDKRQERELSSVATNLAMGEKDKDTEIKASSDLQTLNEEKQAEAEELSKDKAGDLDEINKHLRKIEGDIEELKDKEIPFEVVAGGEESMYSGSSSEDGVNSKETQMFQGDDYIKEVSENEVEPLINVEVVDRESEVKLPVETKEQNAQVEGDSSVEEPDPIESLAEDIRNAGIGKPLEGDLAEQVRNLSVEDRIRLGQMLFPRQQSIAGSDMIQVQGMSEDDRLRYLEGNMSAAEQQWWKINQALLTVEETAAKVYDNETRLINIEDILTESMSPEEIEDAESEEKKENEDIATGITDAVKENTETQIASSNKYIKFANLTLSLIESKFKGIWDNLPFILSGVLLIYLLLRKAWLAFGDTIKGWFDKIWGGIVSVANWVWDAMPKWMQDALRWIWDKIGKGWNWVKGIVKSIIGPDLTWNDRNRVIAETQKELQKSTEPKLEQARNEFNEASQAYEEARNNGVTGEELESLKLNMDAKEQALYNAEYAHAHTYVDAAVAFEEAWNEDKGTPLSAEQVKEYRDFYEEQFKNSNDTWVLGDRHREYLNSRHQADYSSTASQDVDNTGGEGFDTPIEEAFNIIKNGRDLENNEVSKDQVMVRLREAYPELTEQQLNRVVAGLKYATSVTDSRYERVVNSVDKWVREAKKRNSEEVETVEQVTEVPVGEVVLRPTADGFPWVQGETVDLDGGIQVSEATQEVGTNNDQTQSSDTRLIKEDRGVTEILQPEQVYQKHLSLTGNDSENKEPKALAVNNSTVNNHTSSVLVQVYNTQDGVNYI